MQRGDLPVGQWRQSVRCTADRPGSDIMRVRSSFRAQLGTDFVCFGGAELGVQDQCLPPVVRPHVVWRDLVRACSPRHVISADTDPVR